MLSHKKGEHQPFVSTNCSQTYCVWLPGNATLGYGVKEACCYLGWLGILLGRNMNWQLWCITFWNYSLVSQWR